MRLAPSVALAAALLAFACRRADPKPVALADGGERAGAPVTVTLLYTSDEHGWLLSTTEKGKVVGGAAELLGRWIADEGHCPGPPAPGLDAPAPAACADRATIALSGGDNFTGPAISSYFQGAPMVEAMRRIGYSAAALGNHDLDFGRPRFLESRSELGIPYLGANVRAVSPAGEPLKLPPFVVVERRGVKVGIVGLATSQTPSMARSSRFEGLVFDDEERALERAVPEAWNAGVDAVAVVAHVCPDELRPIVARHPEWALSFVGAGHCHRVANERIGSAALVSPGWRMRAYGRARLTIDPSKPARERVTSVDSAVVTVGRAERDPAEVDAPTARAALPWSDKLRRALGEEVGFTKTGLDDDSPEMGRWIAEAWREELGVDVAIVNRGGIRQSVPPGPITKDTVYSVMPFDNALVVCTLSGRDLVSELRSREALAAGATAISKGEWIDRRGKPIAADKRYTVATIDYLYEGGAGFDFHKNDPAPRMTGVDWRAPVLAWTAKQRTSPASPLEERLREALALERRQGD